MTPHAPAAVTPDSFEILVVRELRKAGLEVADVRKQRRTELPEPERGFLLELRVWLSREAWSKRALIACRRQDGGAGGSAIGRAAIDDLTQRLGSAQADVGLLFATADFAPEALAAAEAAGVALLRLVDARTAFDSGGWGEPGHYPSWLPAYLVQVVDRDQAGQVRFRLLEAGGAGLIIDRLDRKEAPHG
jgi:hypothetical protein